MSVKLACTALAFGVSCTRADSPAQSFWHSRASKSVPRMPMVAVLVCSLAASGAFFAISPVIARRPPLKSCITMLLLVAPSLYWKRCTTMSVPGRSVMRVPSCMRMIADEPCEVLSVSPSLSSMPLPRMRAPCPGVCAYPTPRANSTSPTAWAWDRKGAHKSAAHTACAAPAIHRPGWFIGILPLRSRSCLRPFSSSSCHRSWFPRTPQQPAPPPQPRTGPGRSRECRPPPPAPVSA